MPFDMTPVETKPDVFSLEGLIAWLEKQRPDIGCRYEYAGECLIGQYIAGHGGTLVCPGAKMGFYRLADGRKLSIDLAGHPFHLVARDRPNTFGAALTRARQLLASRAP
jgi:hypothetical protein